MTDTTAKPRDPRTGMRGFMFLEAFVRLFIWYSSLAVTLAFFAKFGRWPEQSLFGADFSVTWLWCQRISEAIILYNVVYLLHILIIRLPIPSPKEGEFSLTATSKFDLRLLWAALVAILTRARYEAPFPAFLVYHIANLPPFCWITPRILGPKSRSCLILNPPIPDPDLTEIGRNVTIGNMTSIIAHTQYRDSVSIKKTVIEDDVMIGAHSLIYSGCTIKRGAIVFGGSIVRPNTVIGENEAWGGVPAKKIADLPALK